MQRGERGMFDAIWNWIVMTGMPLVHCYHLICGNIFLGTEAEEARGVEKLANEALAPYQYLMAGQKAEWDEQRSVYVLNQRFDYRDHLWSRTAASLAALPFSLCAGSVLKGIAYLLPEGRGHHVQILRALQDTAVISNNAYYRSLGMAVEDFSHAKEIAPPAHVRRPGDEHVLGAEKEALLEISRLLLAAAIPFWVDCGTCLGAYRYGGVIPWDNDVDIAILQPDFDNVKRVLRGLDPAKYAVQDWSSRDKPKTYLKVYIKETCSLIDIYHFAIRPQEEILASILSNEESIFLPESWKIAERHFTIPTAYEIVFPLKRAHFDGVDLPIPNRTEEYLQGRYGKDISPVKIYNEITGNYEKDLNHPYWKQNYAH